MMKNKFIELEERYLFEVDGGESFTIELIDIRTWSTALLKWFDSLSA